MKSITGGGKIFGKIVFGLLVIAAVSFEAAARTIVYVSNADSREIYVLELNGKTGALKTIEKIAAGGSVMPLAVSPDRKFLYAALRSEPFSVGSYAIDAASGRLTLLKTVRSADNLAYLSTDRTGRFLFGASYGGHKILVDAIEPNGEIDPQPRQVITVGRNAHCILTDLSNRFLFVSLLGEDRLLQFRFDETGGRLAENRPPAVETKKGAGPRHFIFHPNRRLVFGSNELDGTIGVYRLDPAGTLGPLGSVSIMPAGSTAKPWAADLRLTPNGKFLYASERTTSTLAAFRVDGRTGRLTPIGSYPTELQPRGFNISPDGKFLLAAGQQSNSLSVYKIDRKTGALTRRRRMAVGQNPNWIEIVDLPK